MPDQITLHHDKTINFTVPKCSISQSEALSTDHFLQHQVTVLILAEFGLSNYQITPFWHTLEAYQECLIITALLVTIADI